MRGHWTIYAMGNSSNHEFFYVGQTSKPIEVRLHEHMSGCRTGDTQKDVELRVILDQGSDIFIVRLDSAQSSASAIAKEREWIYRGVNLGWRLLNSEALAAYARESSEVEKAMLSGDSAAVGRFLDESEHEVSKPSLSMRVVPPHTGWWRMFLLWLLRSTTKSHFRVDSRPEDWT